MNSFCEGEQLHSKQKKNIFEKIVAIVGIPKLNQNSLQKCFKHVKMPNILSDKAIDIEGITAIRELQRKQVGLGKLIVR